MKRSINGFVVLLVWTSVSAYSAQACHGNSECPSGYVCDTAAGGTCHDPCGTWFPQPNPQCPRKPHSELESLPGEKAPLARDSLTAE